LENATGNGTGRDFFPSGLFDLMPDTNSIKLIFMKFSLEIWKEEICGRIEG
jgi:hypothetical protein